jgi:predicted DNA-binding transcriptional regulator AlpA
MSQHPAADPRLVITPDPEAAPPPAAGAEPARPAVSIHERLTWDLDDLEALTGISRRTWERWKAAGKLPKAIKIGRRVVYSAESIRAFLARGCRP